MIPIKGPQDISILLPGSLRQTGGENIDIDKMGLDLRGLQEEGDGANKEARIKRIAVQFEEMLVNSLLKNAFPEEDKEDEDPEDQPLMHFAPVRDLRVRLLSQHISENGGLGYQEIIEQQLKERYFSGDKDPTQVEKPGAFSLESVPVVPAAVRRNPAAAAEKNSGRVKAESQMVQPVESGISSDFGWRVDPLDGKTRFHQGIDFDVPAGTPVKSAMAGKVVSSGWEKGYGYMVEVKHANGYSSRYGHNSKLLVKKGDKVEAGAVIALSGSTGRSTGPHLHFEIRKGKVAVNPLKVLNRGNSGLYAGLK
jgi:murein DD-endopeptidase MepM/ murein hydrolase activator NlpD